jgi:hypothetical protein
MSRVMIGHSAELWRVEPCAVCGSRRRGAIGPDGEEVCCGRPRRRVLVAGGSWSAARPTRPGWYAFREPGVEAVKVELYRDHDGLWVADPRERFVVRLSQWTDFGGEWLALTVN